MTFAAAKHSRSELYNTSGVDLPEVLREVTEERGQVNRRRRGRWIARHQGRMVDGLRFERCDSSTSSAEKWRAKTVTTSTKNNRFGGGQNVLQ